MTHVYTFEEVKEKFNKNDKLPEGVIATCACGKHVVTKKLSDDDLREIVKILNEAENDTP